MNKKNVVFISMVLICIIILMYVFVVNHKSFYVDIYPEKVKYATYFTDERAQKMFIDESTYILTNLKGHEVYLVDKTMHIDFYFNKDVTKGQIDKARSFALGTFVLKHSLFLGESPYMILNGKENRDKWKMVSCRIYVNDKLNIEENYDEKGILVK